MRKITATLVLLLVLASISTISYALWSETLVMPQQATIPPPEAVYYLEDIVWTNNTEIDWGDIEPLKSYTKVFSVENVGVVNFTTYITTTDLNPAWNLTWTVNETIIINPGKTVDGILMLEVGDTGTDIYEWDMWIHVEEVVTDYT